MSTSDRDTVETVTRLLAERRKVRDWLSALAARRDSTPPAVYQKVHDDYSAKLDKVQAKLEAASDSVQVAAAEVAARLTDKEEAVARKLDERAEAELRFAVGEFGEKEWDKRRTKLDEDLAAVTGERDGLREELHRLRDVLDEVSGASVVPAEPAIEAPAEFDAETSREPTVAGSAGESAASSEEPSPASVARALEPPVGEQDIVPVEQLEEAPSVQVQPAAPSIPIHEQSISAAAEPAQPLAPGFDELAFLKAVVGRPTPIIGTRHPSEPALVPKRATPEPRRPSATPKRGAAAEPPPAKPERAASETPAEPNPYALPEPPTPFPDPVPEPRVSQEMTPPRESFFGRPTPRTSEAIKSLRCQECGTLNYPTEWYCERCGGELAAF